MISERRLTALLRTAFVAALIGAFVLALLPAPDTPRLVSWQDKIEHAVLFFALMVLGAAAWRERVAVIAAGLLGYGAAMELAQALTDYRFGDSADWLADALGVAAGLFAIGARRAWKRRRGAAGPHDPG